MPSVRGADPCIPFFAGGAFRATLITLVVLAIGSVQGQSLDDQLSEAVRKGDESKIGELLKQGANPNAQSENLPLLVWAARQGKPRAIQLLSDAGADVNAASGAALFEAVKAGSVELIETLLDVGADPRTKTEGERTPLHEAAKLDNAKIVRLFVDAGAKVEAVDGRGRTALMDAAEAPDSECLQLLLESGGDPQVKDGSGKNALDLARSAARDKSVALIEAFQKTHGPAPENAVHAKAGDDLVKLVHDAKDGAVIILPSGNFPGAIEISGKSIVLRGESREKTLLTGAGQAAIFVSEHGRVELENLGIRTDDKIQFGVYLQNGDARIRNCLLAGMSGNGCVADGGKVSIVGTEFNAAGRLAIYGTHGAALSIRDCTFNKCQAGAVLKDGDSLGLFDCQFKDTNVGLQARGQNNSVFIRANTGQLAADSKSQSSAVDVDAARRTVIGGNRFANFGQTISVSGSAASPVTVTDNRVLNGRASIYVNASTGSDRPGVLIRNNSFLNPTEYAVLVDKASITAAKNFVTTCTGIGIVLQGKSAASLVQNTIYAPTEAVGAREIDPSAIRFRDNRIVGPIGPNVTGLKTDDATRQFNAAAKKGAVESLKQAAEKICAASTAVKDSDIADSIEKLSQQLQTVAKEGSQFAKVSLHIVDIAGQQFVPDFEVYPDRGVAFDDLFLSPGDIADGAALLARLRAAKDPVSKYLRDSFPADLQQRLDAADAKNPPAEILNAIREALNAAIKVGSFYDKQRFINVPLPPLFTSEINAFESAGKNPPAALVLHLNRGLLEQAFSDEIVPATKLAEATANDRWASVAPGKYWLVPKDYSQFAKQISVAAGETLDAESTPSNAIVLKFKGDEKEPAARILLALKSPERMRESIAQLRRTDRLRSLVAFPRPGASKEQVSGALSLARDNLETCATGPSETDLKGLSEDQANQLRGDFARHLWEVERILAVAGDQKDVELLAKVLPGKGYLAHAAQLIAYVEARLGSLPNGFLTSALKDKDQSWQLAAAIYLHAYGLSAGDAKLLEFLRSPAFKDVDSEELAAFDLLDSSDPATAEAMRSVLARAKKNEDASQPQWKQAWDNPFLPAAIYLLAYGNKEDWQAISQPELGPYHARYLAYLLEDPMPLGTWLAKSESQLWDVAYLSAALRSNGARSESFAANLEDAVFRQAYFASGESGTLGSIKAQGPMNRYQVMTSYWRPQPIVAQWVLEGERFCIVSWVPSPITEQNAKEVRHTGCEYLFDYFPHSDFTKYVAAEPSAKDARFFPLYQASHAVTYRGFYADIDSFHDGTERRPFAVCSTNETSIDLGASAISGVLEVRPTLNEHKLQLALHFRQQEARKGVPFLGSQDFKSKKPMEDKGKSLIDAIRLHRGDQNIALNDRGPDEHGAFIYEAELEKSDLTGLYLDVDLRLHDEPLKAQLVYDLFAGDCARELQRKGLH